jgi:ABC-2 type transport system permease protein
VLYERLAPALEDGGWEVREQRWHANVVTELREAATLGEIGGFIMLDELTLETGEAILYTRDRPSALRQLTLRSSIARAALEFQLEQRGVDVEAMLSGGELRVEMLGEGGSDQQEPQFAVAYIGSFLLYMVILLYAVAVMRATLEEKTNRIVEVVISSMEPWHLMLGKILGVGAVSMTQMLIWMGAGTFLLLSGLPMVVSAQPEMANLSEIRDALPSAGLMLLFVVFFVLGFLMYSGLYAAVGAMCSTDEEAQQAQLPIMMFLVVPIIMVLPVIEDPLSPMSTAMSLFPLFTPILMWGRVVGGAVPPWQIALSIALMALTVLAVAWVAGRIYKAGILMAGKRPTVPELWRWIREA